MLPYIRCGCQANAPSLVSPSLAWKAVSMARSTYMQKIARQPLDVQPALTAGVTIDHVFSISTALIGGIIWSKYGYQYVFLFGMLIALGSVLVSWQVRTVEIKR